MHDHAEPKSLETRPTLEAACYAAGFRRVELVRLTIRGSTVEANATGVLHRYPRTVPISLSTANRLVAAGAPVTIERSRATERQLS